LTLLTDLRALPPVLELSTILSLTHRIHTHSQTILSCPECRKTASASTTTSTSASASVSVSSSLSALPALAEQCLSLFEAVCLAYNIAHSQNGSTSSTAVFDPAALAFEHRFICMRSKTVLGQMELDEKEEGV
ncbi:hypothetical protein BO71DRAFT_279028, partial [Aspergillus ellipticus CBS 707.79]